jgi:hypothetical protein
LTDLEITEANLPAALEATALWKHPLPFPLDQNMEAIVRDLVVVDMIPHLHPLSQMT